ncbi:phosphatase inhibitor-domain-containing protein [Lasiosphaeria miniovina]|uniref:Type 1 phosphatases regulator n=1 Tax=Lasiosphaeria miniovina TaxID=1954250 RepID=A0AA40A0A8_9PEZI|nr:phosphatase inhibitor-domain-containing protein [Lasiosphaeria miniovina]KAK0706704.1 phosphatase inhibitor-domain-containing protein [Lasiosphaeria miniovina]
MATLAQGQAPQSVGSRTEILLAPTQQQTGTQTQAILRLRGAHTSTGRSVQWREDVVDNEGLGRKKSKVCCIYHRTRGVDESSDESSSDSSSSDSDSDREGGSDPRRDRGDGAGGEKDKDEKVKDSDGHGHEGHDCDDHGHSHRHGGSSQRRRRRRPSPNAYEKMPKPQNQSNKPQNDKPGIGGGQGPPGAST